MDSLTLVITIINFIKESTQIQKRLITYPLAFTAELGGNGTAKSLHTFLLKVTQISPNCSLWHCRPSFCRVFGGSHELHPRLNTKNGRSTGDSTDTWAANHKWFIYNSGEESQNKTMNAVAYSNELPDVAGSSSGLWQILYPTPVNKVIIALTSRNKNRPYLLFAGRDGKCDENSMWLTCRFQTEHSGGVKQNTRSCLRTCHQVFGAHLLHST